MIVLEIIIGFYVTFGLLYGIGLFAGWFVRTLPVILVIPAIPFIDAYRMRKEHPRLSKWIFTLWLAFYIVLAFGITMECVS
ncbi:MAG: hypothetical protein KBT67_11105 [bacterium]|nr:hypothetical protein [Candidatus Limimorpha caballi]